MTRFITQSVCFITLIMVSVISAGAAVKVPTPALKATPIDADHATFAAVLTHAVHEQGVDYIALRDVRAQLDSYRKQLAVATLPKDKAGKLALYINAYNAATLELVLHLLPKDDAAFRKAVPSFSVMNVDKFWKNYLFEVAGEWLSLDAIEHERIRPLGEARIHFAVNCASISCPPLLAEPFVVARLEQQLAQVSKAFVADTQQIRISDGKVLVNPILDWFKADFTDGVPAFLVAHASGARKTQLEKGIDGYFEYNWGLNHAVKPAK